MGVGPVGDDESRAGTRPSRSPGAPDQVIEQRQQLGIVTGLALGQPQRAGPAAGVDGQVQLGGQTASGAAQAFAVDRLDRARAPATRGRVLADRGAPFFRAPAACW